MLSPPLVATTEQVAIWKAEVKIAIPAVEVSSLQFPLPYAANVTSPVPEPPVVLIK